MGEDFKAFILAGGADLQTANNLSDWYNDINGPAYYPGISAPLYNGTAIASGNLAPDGWRIPTSSELMNAIASLNGECSGEIQISPFDAQRIGNGTHASYYSSSEGTHGGFTRIYKDCSNNNAESRGEAQDNYACKVRLIRAW